MYFHHSLIPRVAYFLLPLESKQEATSGWNLTKCISEVKVNQLKVKNTHGKMCIPPLISKYERMKLSCFSGQQIFKNVAIKCSNLGHFFYSATVSNLPHIYTSCRVKLTPGSVRWLFFDTITMMTVQRHNLLQVWSSIEVGSVLNFTP